MLQKNIHTFFFFLLMVIGCQHEILVAAAETSTDEIPDRLREILPLRRSYFHLAHSISNLREDAFSGTRVSNGREIWDAIRALQKQQAEIGQEIVLLGGTTDPSQFP